MKQDELGGAAPTRFAVGDRQTLYRKGSVVHRAVGWYGLLPCGLSGNGDRSSGSGGRVQHERSLIWRGVARGGWQGGRDDGPPGSGTSVSDGKEEDLTWSAVGRSGSGDAGDEDGTAKSGMKAGNSGIG